jgi:hypothetical protein
MRRRHSVDRSTEDGVPLGVYALNRCSARRAAAPRRTVRCAFVNEAD